MNLESLQLKTALNLVMKTLPILLVRLGATLVFWLVALIYLAIVGGIAFLIGNAIQILGWILFIVALISVIPIYQLAYRYVFFLIKAAHIAVMAEILDNGDLQDGTGQLAYGRQRVQERFGEVNAMFVVDELVQGVVIAFTRTVSNVMNWLPGDTMDTLVRLVNRVIDYSVNYIDEAVLARSFWNTEQNVWENARDGVVLYAMVWRPILTSAVALMVISFIPAVVALLLFSAPIGALVAIFLGAEAGGWSIILILFFAWMIKISIGDAFAIAAIIATYREETQDLAPDPEMVARLDSVSDQFRDLRQRATEAMRGKDSASPSADTPPAPSADTPPAPSADTPPAPPASDNTPPADTPSEA
jgi:hypothetical protein